LHAIRVGKRLHDFDEFLHGNSSISLGWNIVVADNPVKAKFAVKPSGSRGRNICNAVLGRPVCSCTMLKAGFD
ncbi:MAG: hypothetical protein KKG96_06655, partial [Proteobacteria bacterium]|nr:hypothetical protein [Pseudomonadota bacterium]